MFAELWFLVREIWTRLKHWNFEPVNIISSNYYSVLFQLTLVSSVPLYCMKHMRPAVHSSTIINITLLTSQRGGKWLVHSGAFSHSTCRAYIDNDRSSNSIYATSAPTGAGTTPASGVYEGTSMRFRDLVMLTTVFQCWNSPFLPPTRAFLPGGQKTRLAPSCNA